MCQLLGMNCNAPTDICFSFEGFRARGGKTDEHTDGWGIGFFEEKGCRIFLDDKSSFESPVADLVRHYPIRSLNAIAHIRKATHGNICLQNTHPFQRELWGSYWIFAHNGKLGDFDPPLQGVFQPVGDTDSEKAFCYTLEKLHQRFGNSRPTLAKIYASMVNISNEIASHGMYNFLLSDGLIFFARCSTSLHYIIREAPFSQAHLIDEDVTVDFKQVTSPDDRVAVIATTPLTDNEQWTEIKSGELVLFKDGQPLYS